MLVQTQNLKKMFGGFTALDDCSLSIKEGIVFGLLGPNGAGKTTLLRCLLGFLFPSSGAARVNGYDCHKETVKAHQSLTYLPGDAQLFGSMKGRKVLRFFSRLRSDCHLSDALQLAERFDLDLGRRVAFMSTGMRQKLALCVCLSTRAKVTILDEPTANLDPTVRGEVIRIVDEIRKQGRTVIFSSHVLSEIEEVCDRVVVMRRGVIVRDLNMAELKSKHRVHFQAPLGKIQVPKEFASNVTLHRNGSQVQLDVSGDLAFILNWMVGLQVSSVRVEPIGLRSVYDQCHRPIEAPHVDLPKIDSSGIAEVSGHCPEMTEVDPQAPKNPLSTPFPAKARGSSAELNDGVDSKEDIE